ncbi:neurotrimin isoform X1 [Nerophis lumbriciformis]|uniref:neurotrimin isoform X1 n=1 Tax=Nerophis lumbriciformis TaxID=546530 RepID=UPI002ADF6E25|nr:opioid-binding protein/cell adhesion molecule-like isoform X1 [Nerophis lumbriciformis]XP_061819259.1 opioid-binding protein/cell adhesion molecule-like isoform X1 [Nerophis lumbriciformis]
MSVRGYIVPFFKCTTLLSLRILVLVPAGLPVRSQSDSLPDTKVMDNITVRQGETLFLRCAQGDIVTHTAWLNRSSILYAGDEKWSVDPRVSLVTLNQEEFTIKIENVDMTDEGQYVCAVQTSSRPTTTIIHVLVQVPPKIINLPRDIVVNEGSNVTLMCQADGKPEPLISWKLISSSGDLATDDDYLEIPSISRQRAGTYECTAVNNIDTDTQTVDITVNYAPSVSDGRDVGATLGQRGVLECEADAVPEADFEWYKDDRRISNGFDGLEIVNTGSLSRLTFFNVSDGDYGNYSCVAVNKLGSSNTSFLMYVVIQPTSSTLLQGPRTVQDGSGSAMGLHLHTCLIIIVCLPFLMKF